MWATHAQLPNDRVIVLRGLGSRPGRVIALCFWAKHFNPTVPLSTRSIKRALMERWLLRLTVKILAILRLTVHIIPLLSPENFITLNFFYDYQLKFASFYASLLNVFGHFTAIGLSH